MQRPGLVLLALLAGMIGLVMFTTRFHRSEKPYIQKVEEEENEKMIAEMKKAQERQNAPDRLQTYEKFSKGIIKGEIEVENAGFSRSNSFPKRLLSR